MTVLGPVPARKLGLTLTHEHVLVDFIGAESVSRERYNANEAFEVILPFLKQVRALGCRGFVECTPSYIGKDPTLLRRLAKAANLHVLTNTGYYGAADNKFLPRQAWVETAGQLSARWVAEWEAGIEGTGIHPGFIKIGVGGATLSDVHQKLVRAAALAHLRTGLTIASHTGPAGLAREQLELLRHEGVGGQAFIWVHAQSEADVATTLRVAETGCWVSFDGFSSGEEGRYTDLVVAFRAANRLNQLLLSHDAGWYSPGQPGGGKFRGYHSIFKDLLPSLRRADLSPPEISTLLELNPARAFAVTLRPA